MTWLAWLGVAAGVAIVGDVGDLWMLSVLSVLRGSSEVCGQEDGNAASTFSASTIFVPRPRNSPISSLTENVESAEDSHTHCFSSSFDFECTCIRPMQGLAHARRQVGCRWALRSCGEHRHCVSNEVDGVEPNTKLANQVYIGAFGERLNER